MIKIMPHKMKSHCEIVVPGSKSYTHRVLIASALSNGICSLENVLFSEDTVLTMKALEQMGIRIEKKPGDQLIVYGGNGVLRASREPIYLGNSGTSMRLLTAVASLGKDTYTLLGNDRMAERPVQALIDALGQIGVKARSINFNGCPPVEVNGSELAGPFVTIDCRTSSQYLSGLLLIAPCTEKGLTIKVSEGLVSRPYVDMTIDVMSKFGVIVERRDYEYFQVAGNQTYQSGIYEVEADVSQASYFWAAAAICRKAVKVKGIFKDSCQGDLQFLKVLESMGCTLKHETDGIIVSGGKKLLAVEIDMGDMPDMVPTLAVAAAFAEGTTVIKNVSHLKSKESDRITAVVNELVKMGISARGSHDGLIVTGGQPRGTEIETYGDHRIAMSFAVAGLAAPGTIIRDEQCVEKSFPNYWKVFADMYR